MMQNEAPKLQNNNKQNNRYRGVGSPSLTGTEVLLPRPLIKIMVNPQLENGYTSIQKKMFY